MERLVDVKVLKPGDKFCYINGEECIEYEYLCVHPHNPAYIIAINSLTQNGDKLYSRNLLEKPYYLGAFDRDFVLREELKYHQDRVTSISNLLLSRELP